MTHLKIIQNTTNTEQVTSDIIEGLYNVSKNNQLDNSSDLQGRLEATNAYDDAINYLVDKYQNLYISVPENNRYIRFEDPNMITYLNSIGVGSNGFVTKGNAIATSVVANSQNTTVTKFNELKYFTNITSSKGDWESSDSGNIKFINWTALEEIDISNFTSLGHKTTYSMDTFKGCTSLKTVTASSKLTKIGYEAFSGCTNLEDITGLTGTVENPNVITLVGYAFNNCAKLKDSNFTNVQFTYDETLQSSYQRSNIFNGCSSLTSIELTGITTIPRLMFSNCSNLSTVTVNSGITKIEETAFSECSNLEDISSLSGTITIQSYTFAKCPKLKNSNFTNTQIKFDGDAKYAFQNCKSLTSINLYPDDNIPNCVFTSCTNLEDVIGLPSGKVTVASSSFSGCSNLKSSNFNNIQFMFNMSQIDMTATYNSILSSDRLYCSFKDCSSSNFTSITLSTDNTLIPNQTFCGCTNLTTVTGASNITMLGNHAFQGCQSLTTLDLDCSKVKAIGMQAFYNCQSLTGTLDFTSTLEFINTTDDKGIFNNCKNITRITLPDTITVYPRNLFRGSGITSYVVPTSVTSLGNGCFNSCKDMTSFSFQNNQTLATKIPDVFLAQSNSLVQDIIIPEGIVEIGSQAFAESQGITGVDLPSTITTLGSELFIRQRATKTLIIRASTPPTTTDSTLRGCAFNDTRYQTTIYVPYSQDHSILNAYKNHSYWGQFDNAYNNQILELPQS